MCTGWAVALQQDGDVVVAGNVQAGVHQAFFITRYTPDGKLDARFGRGGRVVAQLGTVDVGLALVIQPDGRIILGGQVDGAFALVRFLPDGSLDATFGAGGVVERSFDHATALVKAIVVTPDGVILATGGMGGGDYPVAEYLADGSPDPAFGHDGLVRIHVGQGGDANAVAVQPDGRIVLAGESGHHGFPSFAVARLGPDGSLDHSFAGNGVALTRIAYRAVASGVVVQADGKIVLAGESDGDIALARYTQTGHLDPGFGRRGIVRTSLGPGSDGAMGIVLQPDGRLVVAGRTEYVDVRWAFALARYDADGTLDATFGDGGIVTTKVFQDAEAESLTLQPDGRVVAAGFATHPAEVEVALARYLG